MKQFISALLLSLTIVITTALPVLAGTLTVEQLSGNEAQYLYTISGAYNEYQAQGLAIEDRSVTGVSFKLGRECGVGGPADGDIEIGIKNATTKATIDSVNWGDINNLSICSYTWATVYFDAPLELDSDYLLYVTIINDSSPSVDDTVIIYNSNANPAAGQSRWTKLQNSGSWVQDSADDLVYIYYYQEDEGTIYSATSIQQSDTTASLYGTYNGTGNLTAWGFQYLDTTLGSCCNWAVSSNTTTSGSMASGLFNATISGLVAGNVTSWRAFGVLGGETLYGSTQFHFQQSFEEVQVSTGDVITNNGNTALISGTITSATGVIEERGIKWSTTSGNSSNEEYSGEWGVFPTGYFEIWVDELPLDTVIYYRAYAETAAGNYDYGEIASFTTKTTLPTLVTGTASVDGNEATLTAEITSLGSAEYVVQRGFRLGTVSGTWTNQSGLPGYTWGIGEYTWTFTDLDRNTTYYWQPYAVTSQGTSYGSINTFSTSPGSLPTVGTGAVQSYTTTTINTAVFLNSLGDTDVTEVGIRYGYTESTMTLFSLTTGNFTTGEYSVNLTGFTPGIIYYQGYAKNSAGAAYSDPPLWFSTITGTNGQGRDTSDISRLAPALGEAIQRSMETMGWWNATGKAVGTLALMVGAWWLFRKKKPLDIAMPGVAFAICIGLGWIDKWIITLCIVVVGIAVAAWATKGRKFSAEQ